MRNTVLTIFLFVLSFAVQAQLITHEFAFSERGTAGSSEKAKKVKATGATSVKYLFDFDNKTVTLTYEDEVQLFKIIEYVGEEEGMSVYILKDEKGKKVELKYYSLGKSVLFLYKREYVFFY